MSALGAAGRAAGAGSVGAEAEGQASELDWEKKGAERGYF